MAAVTSSTGAASFLLLRDSCVSYGYTSRPIGSSGVWESWVITLAEAIVAALLVVNQK